MANLSAKNRRIIEAAAKGEKKTDIAAREYPNQTIEAAKVSVTRVLNKPESQELYATTLQETLTGFNVTWETVLAPVIDALTATKQNTFTGEITTDHTTRLAASKQLSTYMEKLDKLPAHTKTTSKEELLEAIQSGRIDKIQQIIFKDS